MNVPASNDNSRAPAGWAVDNDLWFVRAMRSGDIEIEDESHFGFTCEGNVYVREPQHCYDYDRGVITPLREASNA